MNPPIDINSNDYDGLFDEFANSKQISFEKRVVVRLAKLMGRNETWLSKVKSRSSPSVDDFSTSPEEVSQELGLPVIVRAVKLKADAFPDLDWLVSHRIDGHKLKSTWNNIYHETIDRYGADARFAVCFSVSWSSNIMCIHNYPQVLTSRLSAAKGALFVWHVDGAPIFMQSLDDLINAIKAG